MAANLEKKTFARGTAWSLIDNITSQGITFVVFAVLARFVSHADLGLLTLSLLFVQLFRITTYESIATAIVRKPAPTDVDYNTAFFLCCSLALPAFGILYLSAPLVERYTHVSGTSTVIRCTGIMLITNGLSRIHEAWLTHNLMFRPLAARSSISLIAGGAVGIVMAYRGFGVMSLVAQQLVTAVMALLMLWRLTPWKPKFKCSVTSLRETVGYAKHVSATALTNFGNQNSDSFFVTYFLGAASTGLYAAGKRLCNTINMALSSALLRAALPSFARANKNLANLQGLYLNATTATALLLAPLFSGMAIYSSDLIFLILGKKWLASAPVLTWLAVSGAITSLNVYNQSILLVRNKPQWQTRLAILSAATNILTFLIFTRYGIFYTAAAYSIRAVLFAPISTWCALKCLDISWKKYLIACFPATLGSIVMSSALIVLKECLPNLNSLLNLLIGIFLGGGLYAFVIVLAIPQALRQKLIAKMKAMFRRGVPAAVEGLPK